MKHKITLAFLCLIFIGATFAQQKRTCHAMEDLEERKSNDPSLEKRMAEIEAFTQRRVKQIENYQGKVAGNIITIPVVVHVLYTNSTNNITDAQILSQIEVLNKDFRRTNSDKTNKWAQAADTQIEFAMATVDPNGNQTTAITRKQVSGSDWGNKFKPDNAMKSAAAGGIDPWDTSEYLNMWIVPKMTFTSPQGDRTILGFAQFPGGAAATDGLVMIHDAFGSTGTLNPSFNLGRTTTHEIGHYLNLRHIWGDGPCGSDDFVSDTPKSDAANYGCKTGHTSCGSEDMVQNYMDYSDDACMNLFTSGQKNRMRAVLDAGGSRRALALSDKFGTPVACNATVPTGVSTTGVTATGATVNWSAVSGATYDVRYKTVSASSWSTSAVSTTTKALSGLSASTQYEVQIRSKCSSGNSSYSASVNFTTTAVQINYCASSGNTSYATGVTRVVFGSIDKADGPAKNVGYEDFTSLSTTVSQTSSENLTVSVNTDGNYRVDAIAWIDWNQDGDFADSGETYDLGKISNVSNGALPTKAVAVPANAKVGNTRMRISARYNANPTSCQTNFDGEVEDYTVNITAVVADTTAPLITLNGSATMNLTVGESFTDPGATASDNVDGNLTSSIVVTGNVNTSSVGTYTLNYNVSDAAGNAATQVSRTVTVNADTQAPTVPSNATVSSITQTTATISWTASTDNVAVTEYDVYQGATKLGSTANTTMNITSLTAATGYTFSVKAKDAAGNVSASSNVVNVTTLSNVVSYCDSKGTRVTYEWIDYVSFGGMTNTTAANGGYGDFTSKVANVALGSTNQLVVSAGFSSTAYNEHFTVWIDYNRDGDFTDAGEQVTTGNSSSAANRTADIVIPPTATLGQTRMRVSMKYDAVSTSCEANLGDGEVEDYTVNITATTVNTRTVDVPGESIRSQEGLDLMAYPNPSIDFVQVKLASKSTNMTYKIVNVIGRVVQSGHLDAAGLNVSNLNTGMYILEVNDGQKVLNTKLLKK